jgi:hypothetical protein
MRFCCELGSTFIPKKSQNRVLEAPWAVLGGSRAVLEVSWAVFVRPWCPLRPPSGTGFAHPGHRTFFQVGPRRPQDAPRYLQGGPRAPHDARRRPKRTPRPYKDGPRYLQDGPRPAQDGPGSLQDAILGLFGNKSGPKFTAKSHPKAFLC